MLAAPVAWLPPTPPRLKSAGAWIGAQRARRRGRAGAAYRRLILEEVCPGLAQAVAELPAAGLLSQPLDQQTTPNQIQDLRALLGSYAVNPPASIERFDFAALPELLARTLEVQPAPPVSGGNDSRTGWRKTAQQRRITTAG